MAAAVVDEFDALSTSTSPAALTVPVPRAVAAGSSIVLAAVRDDASGTAGGLASISDTRGNTWVLHDAISLRSGVCEVSLHHCHVTTAIQAGDSITVTWNGNRFRKLAICQVVTGLQTITKDATSGTTVATNPANSGPNGTTAAVSGSTTGSTAYTNGLLVAAVGSGSAGGTFAAGTGFTAGASIVTAGGSADRRLSTEYRTTTTAGTQTATGTLSSSSSWAEAIAHFPAAVANQAPVANAGPDLSNVEPWSAVEVGGVDSDPDGTVASIAWTQTSGPTVTLYSDAGLTTPSTTTANVYFQAPATVSGVTLALQKIVTDNVGSVSGPDFVVVQVLPVTERVVDSGVEVPLRPFVAG